ncbi:MAG: Uma2 family endonuclease [Candidatus Baltobacteraceae bacterium]|jgi:Uma2 family endonuclease
MPANVVPVIPPSLEFTDAQKPYVESIGGRREPKVSPRRRHALLQWRMAAQLDQWARGRGEVGTEWRFYLLESKGRSSSLVPDVAYVSFERLPRELPEDARERPRLAPDIAVEILSPGDSRTTLAEKIALYLRHGARVVIVLDPIARTLTQHAADGVTTAEARGSIAIREHAGLVLDADDLFANL